MGIGIHAGEVFIGNIGSESLMRYNVIGQAVNLCSRVESYSVGGQILASMETLRPIEQIVSFRRSFEIAMKGIREKYRSVRLRVLRVLMNAVFCRNRKLR